MERHVVDLREVDRTDVATVGGKGANLGELLRVDRVRVPPGFCITTEAFRRTVDALPAVARHLDRLADAGLDDLRSASAEIRRQLATAPIDGDVEAAISAALGRFDPGTTFAVRSSATAEDLATASFAGQHETVLDVVGTSAVLDAVRRCWASLFSDRAVAYRVRSGIDHCDVRMAVVVQEMVTARASGVLFTAHPLTGDRTVVSVEATPGLGEALVSGTVGADSWEVRDEAVTTLAITGDEPVLSDAEVRELARTGRRIASQLGGPQDIEWCIADDGVHVVQARPITTLFPVPPPPDDANRVYVSVGHQQMMTDAMKPLGWSVWQLTAAPPMHVAGGRLFVDVTPHLSSPARRAALLDAFGRGDPLLLDALQTVLDRGFVEVVADDAPVAAPPVAGPPPIEVDRAVVTELVEANRASVARLEQEIGAHAGAALLDFVLADIPEMKRLLFDPRSHQVFMAAMDASWWLNEHLQEWLGLTNAADVLTRSVPDNITSEMGLALLDVADAIRPHPEVVAHLRAAADDRFLESLDHVEGGPQARQAIEDHLDRYGMRCVGEIDITRPRWREHPLSLVPLILTNVDTFEPGEAARRFEDGRRQAEEAEREVLARLRDLPGGAEKAEEAKCRIDCLRTFIGYREYPKYGMVSRYLVYKRALRREAERLVHEGVIDDVEDIDLLTFAELHDVVRTRRVDRDLLRRRRDEHRYHQTLRPPRVLTSDGEALLGTLQRTGVPAGALAGVAVSAGTVEGRARIITDLADARVQPGDILVTTHTDPSWSPLFVVVAGLVTEVGGTMTHGAVVAREYGLPAVVGVPQATQRITDGQRIRVDGTDGYVELLPAP